MHRVTHVFRRAADAMLRAPFVTAVAVGTIFVAVLLTGTLAATLEAGGKLVGGWAGEVPVAVFLAPGADLEGAGAAARAIAPDGAVVTVPAAEAMRRLRASLGTQGRVLDGLGDDALPASVEVRVPSLTHARAHALAARLLEIPGVVEVDDAAVWVARLEELVERGRQVGLILLGLLGAATAILVSNTLKLAVYARRDEIDIMKLVGATDLYVAAPILLEGAIQGLVGAGLASATLAAANWALLPRIRSALPLAARLSPGDVVPGRLVAALLLSGAFLGMVASAIALRRFLRRPGG
jgi:cell division transport system permease protein